MQAQLSLDITSSGKGSVQLSGFSAASTASEQGELKVFECFSMNKRGNLSSYYLTITATEVLIGSQSRKGEASDGSNISSQGIKARMNLD